MAKASFSKPALVKKLSLFYRIIVGCGLLNYLTKSYYLEGSNYALRGFMVNAMDVLMLRRKMKILFLDSTVLLSSFKKLMK